MIAVLHITFIFENNGGSAGFVEKELDLPFTPTLDTEFFDVPWHDGKKPISISWSIPESRFGVFLEPILISKSEVEMQKQTYQRGDWNVKHFGN